MKTWHKFAELSMIFGACCIVIPFIMIGIGPVIDLVIGLNIAWYVFWPVVGSSMIVLGIGIKTILAARYATHEATLPRHRRYPGDEGSEVTVVKY